MEIPEDQLEEAKKFTEHYIDLINNHRDTLIYYLTDCATFDWFGKTIKGEKNIKAFLKETVSNVEHDFADPRPVPKIGFRDTHIIQVSAPDLKKRPSVKKKLEEKELEKTPPQETETSIPATSTTKQEEGQGDGFHNCSLGSPTKKLRLDLGQVSLSKHNKIKYIKVEGSIRFHKKSSKKFQKETTWSRPCSLEIAYSGSELSNFTIHLVIYQGSMKCRRNLLKEFDAVQQESGE